MTRQDRPTTLAIALVLAGATIASAHAVQTAPEAGKKPPTATEAQAAAASAFTKLGLQPDLVGKAVPVLTSFVTKSGGAKVGSLLAGALK